MQTLVDLIKKKYPGTTVTSISYDNSDSQAINAQPAFASAITTFASACPRTRMVLLGYSLVSAHSSFEHPATLPPPTS